MAYYLVGSPESANGSPELVKHETLLAEAESTCRNTSSSKSSLKHVPLGVACPVAPAMSAPLPALHQLRLHRFLRLSIPGSVSICQSWSPSCSRPETNDFPPGALPAPGGAVLDAGGDVGVWVPDWPLLQPLPVSG